MDPRPTISENDVHVLVTSRILTMLFAYVSASYRKADESLCFRGMRIPRQEVGFPPLAGRHLFVYLFVCLSVVCLSEGEQDLGKVVDTLESVVVTD